MTTPYLTDELIKAALARRASRGVEGDLHTRVLAAAGATAQRRGWTLWSGETFARRDHRRAIVALAAVALLIATTVAFVVMGMHQQPGNGRGLAFISNGDLWIADVNGARPQLLVDMPGTSVASRPTWVDAATMLYQDVAGGVYEVDLRTPAPRSLATNGALLAISPDHRRVAIGFDRPDGPHLAIVEIATGVVVTDMLVQPAYVRPANPQVGPQVGLTGGPHAWSPDGRWLLGQGFDTDSSATSGWIYQLDVQTGEIRDLATNLCCGLHKPNPVLAPDASQVVYMDYHDAGQGELCDFRCGTLWALDPVTLVQRRLTDEAGSEVGPVFSPDGSWIAFAEYVGTGYDVAIVRADGSNRRTVTDMGNVYASVANIEPYAFLAWDADGGGITFMRYPFTPYLGLQMESQLWHVSIDGSLPVRLGGFTAAEFALRVLP